MANKTLTPESLKAVVYRIAANAMIFNGRDSEFYSFARKLKEECKFLLESLDLNEIPANKLKRHRLEDDEIKKEAEESQMITRSRTPKRIRKK